MLLGSGAIPREGNEQTRNEPSVHKEQFSPVTCDSNHGSLGW